MIDEPLMRTTLAIDDDVLDAAKAIARHQHKTLGGVVSDLARRSLRPAVTETIRNGIPLLPMRNDRAVTLDIVNALRDELPFDRRLSTKAVRNGKAALHVIGGS